MSTSRPAWAVQQDWATIPAQRVADGIERQLICGDRMMVCRLRFAPGVATAVHSHPHEQITLIERGRARFTVAGVDRIASAGDILFFPSGTEHGATMLEEPVVLVDIFSPPREEFLGGATFR